MEIVDIKFVVSNVLFDNYNEYSFSHFPVKYFKK